MMVLKVCAVCLSTDTKFYSLDNGKLRQDYNLVAGLRTLKGNGLSGYLCFECFAYVRRYKKFRDKCQRAHYALKQVLNKEKEITKYSIEIIDRKLIDVLPTLSFLDNSKIHYEEAKFQWIKHNRCSNATGNFLIVHHSTIDTAEKEFQGEDTNINDISVKAEIEAIDRDFGLELPDLDDDTREQGTFDDGIPSTEEYTNEPNLFQEIFNVQEYDVDSQSKGRISQLKNDKEVDGCELDQEYATIVPLSLNESKAVVEIIKSMTKGVHCCTICNKSFFSEKRLKDHSRMHSKLISGSFFCELCSYYYKTDFLLKTHMTEKHMYKYICRKCPEVSFDRLSAKQHYICSHIQKGSKGDNWYKVRPSWLQNKGGKKRTDVEYTAQPNRKIKKLPEDFLEYTPISHNEQYSIVEERQKSMNYLEAEFKCKLCYRGFRETATYNNHLKKHDPAFAGNYQCDVCKLYFKDTRKMYKHMITGHLFKLTCKECNFICYSKGQAHLHYRWHKNVTYKCEHCNKVFEKASTRLTHIRIKHPSTIVCKICGHSFVSEAGLYSHQRMAHSKEEIEEVKTAVVDVQDPFYCKECNIRFQNQKAYSIHFGSSGVHSSVNRFQSNGKPRQYSNRKQRGACRESSGILNNGMPTANKCDVCDKVLSNDVQARKHYESEHPGFKYLKRYMCDICGHTTKQFANLTVHMRTHTDEKPYACPHCNRRFNMMSNRDRHLVVHTGEKRYQCQLCNRRFTQSSAVKLHIQTVHLKIPYAPWDKKNRKRRREMEAASLPVMQPPTEHKVVLETNTNADYLNAYISYNDE